MSVFRKDLLKLIIRFIS